jgi:hypothetical protein
MIGIADGTRLSDETVGTWPHQQIEREGLDEG